MSRSFVRITPDIAEAIKEHKLLSAGQIEKKLIERFGVSPTQHTIRAYMKKKGLWEDERRKNRPVAISPVMGAAIAANKHRSAGQIEMKLTELFGSSPAPATIRKYMIQNGLWAERECVCPVCLKKFKIARDAKAQNVLICSEECRNISRKRSAEKSRAKALERAKNAEPSMPERWCYRKQDFEKTKKVQAKKKKEKLSAAAIDADRRAEGKYESYGAYVAAMECPVRVNVPGWARQKKAKEEE